MECSCLKLNRWVEVGPTGQSGYKTALPCGVFKVLSGSIHVKYSGPCVAHHEYLKTIAFIRKDTLLCATSSRASISILYPHLTRIQSGFHAGTEILTYYTSPRELVPSTPTPRRWVQSPLLMATFLLMSMLPAVGCLEEEAPLSLQKVPSPSMAHRSGSGLCFSLTLQCAHNVCKVQVRPSGLLLRGGAFRR